MILAFLLYIMECMTHSEQLSIYNYQGLSPITSESVNMQVVAQPLSYSPELEEERRRIRIESMESGIPGYIEQGLLSPKSAYAYMVATTPSLASLNDPEARQMVGYCQNRPIALIQYGNGQHRRYQAHGDTAPDRRDAHIEVFSIVRHPSANAEHLLSIGAAMIHALTLDAREMIGIRARVADPQNDALRNVLLRLGMTGLVVDKGYHAGSCYAGLSTAEQSNFGHTLVTSLRLPVRRMLERHFPALVSARQAEQ